MKSGTAQSWLSKGSLLLGLVLTVIGVTTAQAQDRLAARSSQAVPASVEALRMDAPAHVQLAPGADTKMSRSLVNANGPQRVIIRLSLPAGGEKANESHADRFSRKVNIESEQSAFLQRCDGIAPGMRVIARTQLVLNAVFVEVDAAALPALAKDPAVSRIAPVANYEMFLSETVPYIGATAVQDLGVDGSGIRVAVLDSGIDYIHANLGGSGDAAEYAANDPNIIEAGTFPTTRVVGGYDFTGSDWPFGPEAPDPDPLDDGIASGHGSHVADIIGGVNGVAPGADLYAVKVCSSVTTSCSGIALIQGMEFAVDPNGDGNPNDHLDLINMSLGSNFGQPFDDDLSLAVENASTIGVLTVASAGNASDKPYIVGTPSASPSALSVAQTQVPSAALQLIGLGGVDYAAVFQPWSVPVDSTISGPLQYADGAGGNLDGCAPFDADSLTGLIVLVDRGACNFTLKIKNVGDAGGVLGIIGLVAPGAPFSGGDGGDLVSIPGFMISQADSLAMQASTGETVTVDPASQLSLAMQMVGSSSRGPSNFYQAIKPEIGAPGASVSAIAGTGTAEGPFGGTSGAAPMVTGAAALLLSDICGNGQACPSPATTKARLMNTGETNVSTDPFAGLAPITRIGGGEVRVDRALGASAVAVDELTRAGGLSFGFVDVDANTVKLTKKVRVTGMNSSGTVRYTITPTFRYPEDAANGAVSVSTNKSKVGVRGKGSKIFAVTMTIDGSLLPGNHMNSGSEGANPAALTSNEYDGYLLFEGDDGSRFHMPWHVLPRKAAKVRAPKKFNTGGDTITLDNSGVGDAQVDGFALIATSPNLPSGPAGGQSPIPDIRSVGVNTIPVPAGFCSAEESFIWIFAFNTWERQSQLAPVSHQVSLDTDQDGAVDYFIYNFSFNFDFGDGRQLTWAEDATTGEASAFFFAEHSTNTGNTVLYVCGEQVGLTGTDMLATNVDVALGSFDVYFGGPGDFIPDVLTITPLGERFFPVTSDIASNTLSAVDVLDFGTFPGNSEELGVLFITNGDRGAGARGGATEASEALTVIPK